MTMSDAAPREKWPVCAIALAAARASLPPVLFLLVLLGLWEAAVRLFEVQSYLLPPPSAIWTAFGETRGVLLGHLRTTATEAIGGLAISAVAGALTAALLGSWGPLRRMLYPLLVISQNIPLIVIAPLLVLWFGFGLMPKLMIVALIGYFPIVVSTTSALLRADPDLIDLARSLGAKRLQIFVTILAPSALPAFFAGLQISAAYAVLGAVIAEWVGASSGLGLYITRAQTAFRVDRVFVAVFVIAGLSIALFAAVHLLARLLMPWERASTSERTIR